VKAVITKSFARIHQSNLVNMAILPVSFATAAAYDTVSQGDEIEISNVRQALQKGEPLTAENVTTGVSIPLVYSLTRRQVAILLGGGLLNYVRDGGR
jgi:aconitate hydratase